MAKMLPHNATSAVAAEAERLAVRLADSTPQHIIATAARRLPGRLAAVSSFGTESAVLLKLVADVDRSLPVLFLDTLWLFKQTLAYRDQLTSRLGLTNVRTVTPSPSALALADPKRNLCFSDRGTCCEMRKVQPLAAELQSFDGWISGRKRYHGGDRAALAVVEHDRKHIKFNPLARLTAVELDAIFAASDLPRHPLQALGYSSIGCVPCTSRAVDGGPGRSGRWSGLGKTECGIHAQLVNSPSVD